LAGMVSIRLAQEREKAAQRLRAIAAAEKGLDERRVALEETERKIASFVETADEIIELNVGGQMMSTTRAVLTSAEGSFLAGMFSGNFDAGHKRDKDGRIFLDVDPPLFAKILSFLRLCRLATPDCPAPLPYVAKEVRSEYDMMLKYFGLEAFMYDSAGTSSNIFQRIAEMTGTNQYRLQSNELVKITLSSTGGEPATNHEKVLGEEGFHDRSIENSYGAPGIITIRFLKHRVRVEAMELRAKTGDVAEHMSCTWEFFHGSESMWMSFPFSVRQTCTGRLETPRTRGCFVDEITWRFVKDFCLEHIVLYGRVTEK